MFVGGGAGVVFPKKWTISKGPSSTVAKSVLASDFIYLFHGFLLQLDDCTRGCFFFCTYAYPVKGVI